MSNHRRTGTQFSGRLRVARLEPRTGRRLCSALFCGASLAHVAGDHAYELAGQRDDVALGISTGAQLAVNRLGENRQSSRVACALSVIKREGHAKSSLQYVVPRAAGDQAECSAALLSYKRHTMTKYKKSVTIFPVFPACLRTYVHACCGRHANQVTHFGTRDWDAHDLLSPS
jgi:hypothetical protein